MDQLERKSSHHESRRRVRRSASDDTMSMRSSDHSSSLRKQPKRHGSTDSLRKSSNHSGRATSRRSSNDSMDRSSSDGSFRGDSSDHGVRKSSSHGRKSHGSSDGLRKGNGHGRKGPIRRSSINHSKNTSDENGIHSSSHHESHRSSSDHSQRAKAEKPRNRQEDHRSVKRRGSARGLLVENQRDTGKLNRRGSARDLLAVSRQDSDGSLCKDAANDAENPRETAKVKRRGSLRNGLYDEEESRHEKPRRRGSQRNLLACQDEEARRPRRRGSQRNLAVDDQVEKPRRRGSQRNLSVDDDQVKKLRRRGSQRKLTVEDDDTSVRQPRRQGSQRNLFSNDDANERPRRRGSQRNLLARTGSKRGLLVDSHDDKPRRRGSQRAIVVDNEADEETDESGLIRQHSSRLLKIQNQERQNKKRSDPRSKAREPENRSSGRAKERLSGGDGSREVSSSHTNEMPQRRKSKECVRSTPPSKAPPGAIINEDYESMRARIAARFSKNVDTSSNNGNGVLDESVPKAVPSNGGDRPQGDYGDALAKVAEIFGSETTRSSGRVRAQRRSSRMAQEGPSQGRGGPPPTTTSEQSPSPIPDSPAQELVPPTTTSEQTPNPAPDSPAQEVVPPTTTSEQSLASIPDASTQELDCTTNDVPVASTPDVDSASSQEPRRGLSRQTSDDSLDLDMMIAETIHDEIESEKKDGNRKKQTLEDSARVLQRQYSDGSMGKKRNNEPHRGRLRRTTSADQTVDFFPNAIGLKPKDEAVKPLPTQEKVTKKVKKSVRFKDDPSAKRGVALKIVESEGPISPEEKVAGWFSGRDYKSFKQLCYSEATEAKENNDLRRHFERVWTACSSDTVDFAWQEIMNAEHKKNAPNSAVILAKARSRGYERDAYPETLLRNRLIAIRAIVNAYDSSVLSMTLSAEDQAETVRKVSQKVSLPFRRFARLMAEGDSLLVMAWERVSAKKKKKQESESPEDEDRFGDSSHHMGPTPAGADRRDHLNNLQSQRRPEDNRRSLLESSASCRRLLDSHKGSRREQLVDTRRMDNRRALLESSTSVRRLLDSHKGSRRDHLLDTRGIDSRRALLESSVSSRKLCSLLDKDKPDLIGKSRSSRQNSLHSDDDTMDDRDNTFTLKGRNGSLAESSGPDSQGYKCHYLKNRRDGSDSDSDSEEPAEPSTLITKDRRLGMQRRGSSKRLLVATPSRRNKVSIKASNGV